MGEAGSREKQVESGQTLKEMEENLSKLQQGCWEKMNYVEELRKKMANLEGSSGGPNQLKAIVERESKVLDDMIEDLANLQRIYIEKKKFKSTDEHKVGKTSRGGKYSEALMEWEAMKEYMSDMEGFDRETKRVETLESVVESSETKLKTWKETIEKMEEKLIRMKENYESHEKENLQTKKELDYFKREQDRFKEKGNSELNKIIGLGLVMIVSKDDIVCVKRLVKDGYKGKFILLDRFAEVGNAPRQKFDYKILD